jgi:hypothetical protein
MGIKDRMEMLPNEIEWDDDEDTGSAQEKGQTLSNHFDAWGQAVDLASDAPPWAKPAMGSSGPNQAMRDQAKAKGGAQPDGSFPLIGPDGKPSKALFVKATKMVQLAKGDQTKIRRWLMAQAKKNGWEDAIPSNWQADGTTGTGS